MTSCNFAYGEQSAIANAYASMYAPKSHVRHDLTESCKKDGDVKTVKTEKNVTKHKVPKGTGSKLGRRPVLPFKKRDAKSTATKFAPKAKVVESEGDEGKNGFVKGVETAGQKTGEFVKDAGDTVKNGAKAAGDVAKKGIEGIGGAAGDMMSSIGGFVQDNPKTAIAIGVAAGTALATKLLTSKKGKGRKDECANESVHRFVIADGDSTLCTTDLGESYFNESGICGETRIYESRCSAIKDIAKVRGRRKAKDKYKVRGCEAVGESFQFSDSNGSTQVNEGFWDSIGNGIKGVAGGIGDAVNGVASGVGNVVNGAAQGVNGVVGGLANGVSNLAQGNFSQAAKDVAGGVTGGVGSVVNGAAKGVGDVVNGAAKGVTGTVDGVSNGITGAAGSFGDFFNKKEDAAAAANAAAAQSVQKPTQPMTDAQKQYQQNGGAGPVSDEEAKKKNAAAAATATPATAASTAAQPNTNAQFQPPVMAGMSPNVASAVSAAMGNGGTTPQGKMAAPAQKTAPASTAAQPNTAAAQPNANGGQDNAAKKVALQKEIEQMQKQLEEKQKQMQALG